jgi:hypothetical protein
MYKGVNEIQYSPIDSIDLAEMSWVEGKGAKYLEEMHQFIDRNFDLPVIIEFSLKNLTSLILENVEVHGSGSCKMSIGIIDTGYILEIYEENGGFDLNNLPHGTGGCGFRAMKNSKCHISHSSDGRRTFILVPNKNKKVKQI